MKRLNEEQACSLSIGVRVLVRVLETNQINLGVVTVLDKEHTSIEEYHGRLGVVYTDKGFDVIDELFDTNWCDTQNNYCEFYKLEGDELV